MKTKIKLKTIQNIKTTKGMSIKMTLSQTPKYIYICVISFPCSMFE